MQKKRRLRSEDDEYYTNDNELDEKSSLNTGDKLHAGRVRLTYATVAITLLCLGWAFVGASGPQFLSPGPLISAHSTIEDCGACHTQPAPGKFGWLQRVMHDSRSNDVQACISCHKVNGDVTFAHTAKESELHASQLKLLEFSDQIPKPLSAKLRNIMFPEMNSRTHNLLCANCHQEHQGADFNLEAISNEQCQSCHVVQFDSFEGNHPAFDDFPFKRRTRLIYDHAGHFSRHFPATSENDPQRAIPDSCSSCHTNQKDKRHMMLTSFDKTCSGCHLGQIRGEDRASDSKGIAFLTLPGVDVRTLNERNAAIGEWPESSEAEITPFMKVLLSRDQARAELLKEIGKIDLLDLTQATDQEIETVTRFVWEIKGRIYAAVSGAETDVLADLPLDLIVAGQREWLPNLWSEMASRGEPAATPVPAFAPVESTVNPESWAEYGGWYRQDFAIRYRPVGHKDQFIRTWVTLTAPHVRDAGSNPAAEIFTLLTAKDAPGACMKCHSVDAIVGQGRKVNWLPGSPDAKHGRFTTFTHEPHFGALKHEDKGCLTCHRLQKGVPFGGNFEHGDPESFVPSFSQVDKELCQTCHKRGVARQDCMLCHKYHINGIVTPIMETKLPKQ
jgi:hypothetical protein